MGMHPGSRSNNPNGRTVGSKNRDLDRIRKKYDMLLNHYTVEDMVKDLKGMTPKDRLTLILGFSEFVLPKLARVELNQEVEHVIQVYEIGGTTITF